MNRIRPELVAAKLQAIRNLESPELARQLKEQPRLVEMLMFIQAMSLEPGGLDGFAERLIEASPERFATNDMVTAGAGDKSGLYSLPQCLTVWRSELEACARYPFRECFYGQAFQEWLVANIGAERTEWLDLMGEEERVVGGESDEKQLQRGLREFNRPFFHAACISAARDRLGSYLEGICTEKGMGFSGPWYCPDLVKMLFDAMDRHAQEERRNLAETEISKKVFHWLEFSYSTRTPVPIVGASRFGKTTSVSVWCKCRPGLRRLVTVPESNRERDFFAAHADALGIEYTEKTTTARLKDTVEYVIRHTGLFLVFDEAHFLIPVSYSRSTAPGRLNWVRCQVIDRGMGCAFFATPQSYRQTLSDFAKHTGYNFDQWLGRMARPVTLPEELGRQDLLAVAKVRFPDLSEDCLGLICARSMRSEGYLKNMELAANYAGFLASERGGRNVTWSDVEKALEEILPGGQETAPAGARKDTPAARCQVVKRAAQRACNPLADGPQAGEINRLPALGLPGLAGQSRPAADLVEA